MHINYYIATLASELDPDITPNLISEHLFTLFSAPKPPSISMLHMLIVLHTIEFVCAKSPKYS